MEEFAIDLVSVMIFCAFRLTKNSKDCKEGGKGVVRTLRKPLHTTRFGLLLSPYKDHSRFLAAGEFVWRTTTMSTEKWPNYSRIRWRT